MSEKCIGIHLCLIASSNHVLSVPQGAKGFPGLAGKDGAQGARGGPGPRGAQGDRGPIGSQVMHIVQFSTDLIQVLCETFLFSLFLGRSRRKWC